MDAGDNESAIDALKKVYELDETHYNATFQLGNIYMSQNNYFVALEWYLIALAIEEKESAIHSRLSDLYDAIGDEDMAEKHAKLAQKYRNYSRSKKKNR